MNYKFKEYEWVIYLDKLVIIKAFIHLGIVTFLFESVLYKLFRLVKNINNKEIISKKSSKILKSMGRFLMLYIIATIFMGQINNISFINSDKLIYKNEFFNKVMGSFLFNRGFDAIIMGTMIAIVIILLQVLIEGEKIKEENDLTV